MSNRVKRPAKSALASSKDVVCRDFLANPGVNPTTGFKIKFNSKYGLFAQLSKLCGTPSLSTVAVQKKRKAIKKTKVVDKTNTSPSRDREQARAKLADALKKVINPILNKGDSLKSRNAFATIMSRYLESVDPCLHVAKDGKLSLYRQNEPIVQFDRRIGSDSVFGIAYMNMGKGFARLLKFACKIMRKDTSTKNNKVDSAGEISLYNHMTYYVRKNYFPNFPITYSSIDCNMKCKPKSCPVQTTDRSGYHVIMNELADMDIQTWFKKQYKTADYISVMTQMIFAIYAFHGLGAVHRDTHLGNFLIHKVTPGGFWRYRFEDKDIYIPNTGYLLVIWDPGMATVGNYPEKGSWQEDMMRPLKLISYIGTGVVAKYDNELLLKAVTSDALMHFIKPMISRISLESIERYAMREIIGVLGRLERLGGVHIRQVDEKGRSGEPPGTLLNILPYNLDATLLIELNAYLVKKQIKFADMCDMPEDITNPSRCVFNGTVSKRFEMLNGISVADLTFAYNGFTQHNKATGTPSSHYKQDWYVNT